MIIGIDMGGTHIDGVIINNKKIIKKTKNKSNHDDIYGTVWKTLKELLIDINKNEISRIQLSTTVSTNAIVQNKIPEVGIIVQTGPGVKNDFSNLGENISYISGYMDHRGEPVKDFDKDEIKSITKDLTEKNIDDLAVITKFCTRNPSYEVQIKEQMNNKIKNITLGHSMSGKLNFPRRVRTAYLNAAVYETFYEFADSILKSLKEEDIFASVYILKADGGTMDLEQAIKKPVETILSGPAASFMGLNALNEMNKDTILLDIGGTTTDIFFLVSGSSLFEPEGIKINEHKTLVRAIYSVSIGIGGDSFVRVENGKLEIGPERKGTPAGFGGKHATPTDAMIFLDLIKDGDKERSTEVIESIAKKLELSSKEIANLILEEASRIIKEKTDELLMEINNKPVYTVKEFLEDAKIIPEEVFIIGGPAEILSSYLEEQFKLNVECPQNYEVANAIGAALSKPTIEINMIADTDRGTLSIPEVGIYERIDNSYNLEKAKKRALDVVTKEALKLGAKEENLNAEIIEVNSFNMIKGFFGASKNIRVQAQVKPGLIYKLEGELNES